MITQALKDAIKILERRDYSEHKLRQKLLSKNHFPQEIDDAISTLVEKNLFDESRYTESRVRGLIRKNYSCYAIAKKLEQEHIEVSLDFIESVFADLKVSEQDQIFRLIQKKEQKIARQKEKGSLDRLTHSLMRYFLAHGHFLNLENIKDLISQQK